METAEELYNLPLDKAATKVEKFSDSIDLLDKKLDNAIGSKKKNKLVDQQTKQEKNTLNAYKSAKTETKKNLKSAGNALKKSSTLNSSDVSAKEKKAIKKAVKNGKEVSLSYFKEGSKAYNAAVKYNEALKANTQATYDLAVAQQEYNSWLVEASKIKFDNIADDYEKKVQMLDHEITSLDNRISEIETAGKKVDKSYYESQKSVTAEKLAQYQAEKAALEKSIKNIKKGTDEWYEAYDQIQQVSASISDCVKETYELNNAINQLHFDLFDEVSERIGRIITEQEFLQGLFAHEKTADEKTGNLTEAGIAKLGSLSTSYYASKNNAGKDAAMVKDLQNVKEKGRQADGSYKLGKWEFNSLEDLQAEIDETYTKWQDDIKETYSLETEIADLMKEKYQAELDMLKELIDSKKEALDAEKDLHDYQKSITEKTNDISTIKKQMAAYKGDSSQEGMAKLQKLQKELADKEEDLREAEYDRYISDQKEMLDKLYKEYKELVTKHLEDFMVLVQEGLDTANDNMAAISDYLHQTASDNGYIEETKGLFNHLGTGISDSIKTNVDNIIAAIAEQKEKASGTQDVKTGGLQQPDVKKADDALPGMAMPERKKELNDSSGRVVNTAAAGIFKGQDTQGMLGTFGYSAPKAADPLSTAKKYIKSHANKAGKSKKEYSDVNQKIYENKAKTYSGTGKILSADELKELAKKLGVTYDNAKKSGNLYKKLKSIKFPGFKKGGIVAADDIKKRVIENGDDGIGSLKVGEAILTPVQTDLFQKFTKMFPDMLDSVSQINKVAELVNPLEHFGSVSNSRSMNNIVNIDNITLPNVTNYQEFKAQMLHDIQTEKKTGMLIRDVAGVNQIAGDGRLSKFRNRL